MYTGGQKFLRTHAHEVGKHLGKWILICDDKIFAADDDLVKIYKKFKAENPGKVPFVIKFPKEEYMAL